MRGSHLRGIGRKPAVAATKINDIGGFEIGQQAAQAWPFGRAIEALRGARQGLLRVLVRYQNRL